MFLFRKIELLWYETWAMILMKDNKHSVNMKDDTATFDLSDVSKVDQVPLNATVISQPFTFHDISFNSWMSGVNEVTLLGRVGGNPLSRGSDRHPVVTFNLATHTRVPNPEEGIAHSKIVTGVKIELRKCLILSLRHSDPEDIMAPHLCFQTKSSKGLWRLSPERVNKYSASLLTPLICHQERKAFPSRGEEMLHLCCCSNTLSHIGMSVFDFQCPSFYQRSYHLWRSKKYCWDCHPNHLDRCRSVLSCKKEIAKSFS